MKLVQRFAGVLGIILMIFFACGVVFWETVGRNMYQYQEVIVLNQAVKKGDLIDSKNIKNSKIEKDSLIDGSIISAEQVVGKAAKNFIPANAQISSEFLTDSELSLREDQFIFKFPTEWVKAVPSSIRRTDKIEILEVIDEDQLQNKQNYIDGEDPQEKTDEKEEKVQKEQKVQETYPTVNDKTELTTLAENGKPILETFVIYVKDNANREVVTVGDKDRYDGSSQVSDIEIVVTSQQVELLKESVKNGNKFLIMYQEN